jgi:hypothetical protein
MNCPYCSKHVDPLTTPIGFESNKQKIKLIGNIGPFMREYRCMICGGVWRYDIAQAKSHPYSSFKKGLKVPPGFKTMFQGRVPLLGSRRTSPIKGKD